MKWYNRIDYEKFSKRRDYLKEIINETNDDISSKQSCLIDYEAELEEVEEKLKVVANDK
jgi:ribulose 1,5-bisphosphate carboxylase large subunit-like protein